MNKKMQDKNKLLGGLLLAGISIAATAQTPPADPNTFLTFLEHFQPEDSTTARAYYTAVDPQNKRTTVKAWLKNAGFIADEANFVSSGTPGNPGDDEARSNSFSFALYRNAADLGFIRRMFIRCSPSCTAPNPNVYTYVENYLYLEGAADPYSDGKNRTNRVATVVFEWVPAADGSNPTKKFGTMYTFAGPFLGADDTRDFQGPEPFAPDLDFRGNKQQPGACLACHGGFPQALVNGVYPNKGEIKGFKFLPFDLDNFEYDTLDPNLSRAAQELAFKRFNQAVLLTHKGRLSVDDQGLTRFPAGKELIEGWYGGPTLPGSFNGNFIPKGWREAPPPNGSNAPAGSENLYLTTIRPACRGCHVQQGLALDLASQKGFMGHVDNVKQLVLRIECGLSNSPPGRDDRRVMPLALLTYDRFWRDDSQVNTLKDYLGLPHSPLCN
ncbi:MAG: hypothetical protein HOO93_08140 [Methyloglobulus sp.]|nr:hypothetical protein [Methyloglobulus sp.]